MIEQTFKMTAGNQKTIEKIIQDENIHYNHMILSKGDRLPVHFSNSNVYMTVLRGRLTIGLDEQQPSQYDSGTILKIPSETRMDVANTHDGVLEITVVKAPAPTN